MTPTQRPDLPALTEADAADPFYAPEAVRARIRRRWERRRAETAGGTVALSRWSVNGRYTYARREGWAPLDPMEAERFRGGREHLVHVQLVQVHPWSL